MFEIEIFSSYCHVELKDQLKGYLNKLNKDEELFDVKFSSNVVGNSSGEFYEFFSVLVIVKKQGAD